jgi:hypothetical protein
MNSYDFSVFRERIPKARCVRREVLGPRVGGLEAAAVDLGSATGQKAELSALNHALAADNPNRVARAGSGRAAVRILKMLVSLG